MSGMLANLVDFWHQGVEKIEASVKVHEAQRDGLQARPVVVGHPAWVPALRRRSGAKTPTCRRGTDSRICASLQRGRTVGPRAKDSGAALAASLPAAKKPTEEERSPIRTA